MQQYSKILIGVAAGATIGVFLPDAAQYLDFIGTLFLNALQMIVVPIVLLSLFKSVFSLATTGDKNLGRVARRTTVLYLLTMTIAILTGLSLVLLLAPGVNCNLTLPTDNIGVQSLAPQDILLRTVPRNIFAALADNNTLPVILIAVVGGLALASQQADKARQVADFLSTILDTTYTLTDWILRLAPYGLSAVVAVQFAKASGSLSLLSALAMYLLTVFLGLAIHTFLWLPLLLRFVANVNPWRHLRNMRDVLLVAFSTASTAATIPYSLRAVSQKDGVSSKITDFVIPLGATVNMAGCALLECVAVVFVAQAYGVNLSLLQTVSICITSLLCAIGSAGIPMAALVMMTVVLSAAGLPVEGVALVAGVDRVADMMRTAVNVYGDTCVAVLVAKQEGESLSIDKS